MADRFDRDKKQAKALAKRSFEKIASKYEALCEQYENHERIAEIAGEYIKWLALLLAIADNDDQEGRMAVMARLEKLICCEERGGDAATVNKPGVSTSRESEACYLGFEADGSEALALEVSEPVPLSAHEESPVVGIVLNDGSIFPVGLPDVKRWEELYPAVDIVAQLRKMAGWSEANPKKRKTKSGVKRFINAWLAKEQDRGGACITGVQYGADGTAHPDGGVWMSGRQVLGVTPK